MEVYVIGDNVASLSQYENGFRIAHSAACQHYVKLTLLNQSHAGPMKQDLLVLESSIPSLTRVTILGPMFVD